MWLRTFTIIVLFAGTAATQTLDSHAKKAPTKEPPAQKSTATQSKAPSYKVAGDSDMWLENAKVLTEEALADANAHMDDFDETLLRARLAASWWKDDEKRAHEWIKASADRLMKSGLNEPIGEALRRLNVEEDVARILAKIDPLTSDALVDNILDRLPDAFARAGDRDEKQQLSLLTQKLGDFGRESGNPSPARDAKLARVLMRDAETGSLSAWQAIDSVYRRNPPLGDQLFTEMLGLVDSGQVPAYVLINMAMFIYPGDSGFKNPDVSPGVKQHFMDTGFATVTKAQISGLNEDSCRDVLTFAQVLKHFAPEKQAQLKPAFEACVAKQPDDSFANSDVKGLGGADDFLKAASESTDVKVRAHYKVEAAMSLQSKDPERALEIVDGMSDDERKDAVRYMGMLREHLEASLIQKLIKAKDYPHLQRLIDQSPNPAQSALAVASAAASHDDVPYATSLMPKIRQLLDREPVENPAFYLELVRVFSKLARSETPIVLQEAMKNLESFPEVDFEKKVPKMKDGEFYHSSFWSAVTPAPFPDLLDVIDQRMMRQEIDQMKYPAERASMRLWLLRGELKAYEAALLKEKPLEVRGPTKAPSAVQSPH